jgi:hypothetical protein
MSYLDMHPSRTLAVCILVLSFEHHAASLPAFSLHSRSFYSDKSALRVRPKADNKQPKRNKKTFESARGLFCDAATPAKKNEQKEKRNRKEEEKAGGRGRLGYSAVAYRSSPIRKAKRGDA